MAAVPFKVNKTPELMAGLAHPGWPTYERLSLADSERSPTVNRTKQLTKSPKYYWSDSGFAMALSREQVPRGAHFENIVLQDLLAWKDSRALPPDIFFWRTSKGYEVDFVIEDGAQVLPIEVKTTTRPSTRELASMQVFLDEYKDRAKAGVLLYTGEQTFWIGRNVLAVPWWKVL